MNAGWHVRAQAEEQIKQAHAITEEARKAAKQLEDKLRYAQRAQYHA
jgi:hypothetical protein